MAVRARASAAVRASLTLSSTSGLRRRSASFSRSAMALSSFCSASRMRVAFSSANLSSASRSRPRSSSSASRVACSRRRADSSRSSSSASLSAWAMASSSFRVASAKAACAPLIAVAREGRPETTESHDSLGDLDAFRRLLCLPLRPWPWPPWVRCRRRAWRRLRRPWLASFFPRRARRRRCLLRLLPGVGSRGFQLLLLRLLLLPLLPGVGRVELSPRAVAAKNSSKNCAVCLAGS
mmetsp:Transcript_68040/g.199126  ORF Transcript_68040/g.199126 Transcript_68040/m.199126 type:complete len:237 (-) Transcript_68040:150-860(-)